MKTIEDLCGKNVGASRSTNWPSQMEELEQDHLRGEGQAGDAGGRHRRLGRCADAIESGRLDAAVQGSETLPYFQKQEPNTIVLIGTPFSEQLSGIPVMKTDPQLRDAIKEALERLQSKGIYDQILAKYGLQGSKLTPAGVNQGK